MEPIGDATYVQKSGKSFSINAELQPEELTVMNFYLLVPGRIFPAPV